MNAPAASPKKPPPAALIFGAALVVTLVLGGLALGVVYLAGGSDDGASNAANGTSTADADGGGSSASNESGAGRSNPSGGGDGSSDAGPSIPLLPRGLDGGDGNGEGGEPAPLPAVPAVPPHTGPSALGVDGAADALDVPIALPKGMLPFLRGVDLLGSFKPMDAIPSFVQAVAADEENSDYHTARGAAYVLAERMKDGLPDLQRALKLNPRNILASRMTRLAYLMLGDQLAASKFYGHGSTQNADFLITEVGVGYGNRVTARQHGYPEGPQDKAKADAAVQKLPTVAGMVAAAYRSGEQKSVQAVFALGVEQIRSGDFAAARRSFRDVLARFPHDWTSHCYHARSLLETGNPEEARRELTYVLCWKRFLPDAFVARALAAARQGDRKRAEADLAAAERIDAGKARAAKSDVEAWLKRASLEALPNDPAQWDALGALAKGGASFDELAAAALKLRRSVDAKRKRWDEAYQDRLHELCAAARAKPGDAGRLAAVAEFLRENNDVQGLTVEQNGAARWFRRQTNDTKKWEIDLAFALAGEGLAADNRNARCWAVQCHILLLNYHKAEEAERAGLAAVQCDPKLPGGHVALSDVYHEYAVRQREQAAVLRAGKTGTRSVNVVNQYGQHVRTDTETYHIPPTAEELAQAAALEAQAAANDKREQSCLSNALAASKGTKEEPFYQALLFYLRKDYAQARPWLEKAVQQDPENPKAHLHLSYCLRALGLEEEHHEAFARAINLQETSAEGWLKLAWTRLERNAYDAARTALARARPLDPSDARIWAYCGILAQAGSKDLAEAAACYRAALAQEEARARANGTTYGAAKDGAPPLSPQDIGLSAVLRLKLAKLAFRDNPAQAAAYYLDTAEDEQRLSDWSLTGQVHSAMLPFPERPDKQPPGGPALVALLKNNRIFLGQALLSAGRGAEAARHIAEAENFGNRLPAGGTIYLEAELEDQYVPFRVSSMPVYVKVLNAQALLAQGKRDDARMLLVQVRFYLANRSMEQRAMTDDPIPGLYEKLAPQVGLR